VRNLNRVKTAVASLVLGSTAVVWALPPQLLYSASTTALEGGAIAITTTVPATYVVAAEANATNDLEVIAWHDTGSLKNGGLVQLVDTGVVDGPGLQSVGITGLDSSRVVTADIDSSSILTISTWTVGPAGVVALKAKSTGANVAYQNVAITTLSPTEVVVAYQLLGAPGVSASGGASLAAEEWTIAADGSPSPEGTIAFLPGVGNVDQVSIATVNSNEVVTAANDDDNDTLWVATWGVDSAGVQSPQAVSVASTVSRAAKENLGIGAGTTFRFQDHFPYLEEIQSAFTPVIYEGQVGVINWGISATGVLTQKNTPVWTTTPGEPYFQVSACMVAGKVPMTIYGDNGDNSVDLEVFPYGSSFDTYSATSGSPTYGIDSIASAAAGNSAPPLLGMGVYNGYFVTAVLTHYPADAPSAYINNLAIRKWSYQVEETLF